MPADKAARQSDRRIGLRTLNLLRRTAKTRCALKSTAFRFSPRARTGFRRTAFANRVTPEILRRYVADAAAVNMNTLRFWGGGYYEEDALYDACDEMGICVWLDFKFACSTLSGL